MTELMTGPRLRDRIQHQQRCWANYRYCDADAHMQPEYVATHIRIRAYHVQMSEALVGPLAAALEAMPGCVAVEQITRHLSLRPQVVALFDRSMQ